MGRPLAGTGRDSGLLAQAWFLGPLAFRVLCWLLLAHVYEIAVFEDVSRRMVAGEGIYTRFAEWMAAAGDGYYAYPPVYAYMLWVSGALAQSLGGSWWLHQLLIKAWLVLADAIVFAVLYRLRPAAARTYWTAWFIPVVAIGQVQPDLWVGLSILLTLLLVRGGRYLAAGAVLALGAGVKPFPLVLLPFLAIYLIQRNRWRGLLQAGAGIALGTALVWLPYLIAFRDAGSFGDLIRFQLERPIAGLTFLSGMAVLTNAAAGAAMFFGHASSAAGSLYEAIQSVGIIYPWITAAALGALAIAASRKRWSLRRMFVLAMLVLLLSSKVVHEHYLLQVLPLLLFFGFDLRAIALAYGAYVLAAGTPLRFFPRQLGLPAAPDALLPALWQPSVGTLAGIGLLLIVGLAALAFSVKIARLVVRELRVCGPSPEPVVRMGRGDMMPGLKLGSTVLGGILLGAGAVALVLGLSDLEIRVDPRAAPALVSSARLPAGEGGAGATEASGAARAAQMAVLEIGPVPETVAAEIAAELTLAGLSVRVKLRDEAGQGAVVTVGPHLQTTIEEIAARLRSGSRTVTLVIHSGL